MNTYYNSEFDILKDKQIFSVEYTEEKLIFNIEHGAIVFLAVGECCSSSYIESLDNPEIFNNAKFISAESVEGETKENDEGDYLNWTFYKFKTDKGMCTLSFRNESNGYYDGHLELVAEVED